MENPLLSICIPTWNKAKFLKLSLESIGNQYNVGHIVREKHNHV